MRIAYVELSGFRGYKDAVRVDFGSHHTVIDGRNGVGKSTIFDAVEFALTGALTKYREAKADGETVKEYLWWKGEGTPPKERFVEVGFHTGGDVVAVRRTPFTSPSSEVLQSLVGSLCHEGLSPQSPLTHLCSSFIIRDEHITTLSMDLKETERYLLMRDALGANDADQWIERAAALATAAKRRTQGAESQVNSASADLASASRRLDEARAALSSDEAISAAAETIRNAINQNLSPDQLIGPAQEAVRRATDVISKLRILSQEFPEIVSTREALPQAQLAAEEAITRRDSLVEELSELGSAPAQVSHDDHAALAKKLVELVSLGKELGLQGDKCPLCLTPQSNEHFQAGLEGAMKIASSLNEAAASAARRQAEYRNVSERLAIAISDADKTAAAIKNTTDRLVQFGARLASLGLDSTSTSEEIADRLRKAEQNASELESSLGVLSSLRMSEPLDKAIKGEAESKERLAKAQAVYGTARKAEAFANALHDAARRAVAETLDLRLEKVLPLMSELYQRLKPHPVWTDIEYSIRGDVKRFMKLQVGNDLNPQFLFSSGQRRATGLAFLLAVNLSLSWSKLRLLMLDDPVQHVDDFRAVHLAEVLAQLCSAGWQIVCAVEDPALADLISRRLPVEHAGSGKRVTLGPDETGTLRKLLDEIVPQLPQDVLVERPHQAAV